MPWSWSLVLGVGLLGTVAVALAAWRLARAERRMAAATEVLGRAGLTVAPAAPRPQADGPAPGSPGV